MYRILLQTLKGRDFLGILRTDGIAITDNASSTSHNLWVTKQSYGIYVQELFYEEETFNTVGGYSAQS